MGRQRNGPSRVSGRVRGSLTEFLKYSDKISGSSVRFPGRFLSVFLRGFGQDFRKAFNKTWKRPRYWGRSPRICGFCEDFEGGSNRATSHSQGAPGVTSHSRDTGEGHERRTTTTDDGRRTTTSSCPRGGARTQLPPEKQKLAGAGARMRSVYTPPRCAPPLTQAHIKGRRALVGYLLPRGCACVGLLGRAPSPVGDYRSPSGEGAGGCVHRADVSQRPRASAKQTQARNGELGRESPYPHLLAPSRGLSALPPPTAARRHHNNVSNSSCACALL